MTLTILSLTVVFPHSPFEGQRWKSDRSPKRNALTVVFPHSPFEGSLPRRVAIVSLSLWFSPTAPLKGSPPAPPPDPIANLSLWFSPTAPLKDLVTVNHVGILLSSHCGFPPQPL